MVSSCTWPVRSESARDSSGVGDDCGGDDDVVMEDADVTKCGDDGSDDDDADEGRKCGELGDEVAPIFGDCVGVESSVVVLGSTSGGVSEGCATSGSRWMLDC